MIKHCQFCNKEFETAGNNHRKFCNSRCLSRSRYSCETYKKNCLICNKEFEARSSTNKYCSHVCRGVAKKLNSKDRNVELKKKRAEELKVREKVDCEQCKKPFVPRSRANKFCGVLCRTRHQVEQNQKQCPVMPCAFKECSFTFIRKNPAQIYCSRKCKEKGNSARKSKRYAEFMKRDVTKNRECTRCSQKLLSPKSRSYMCDRCFKDVEKIRQQRKLFNAPESDIIFEPDSNDFFNSPWTRLQQRHHIDLEPTDSSVEESEFRNEIQNYLKKGGKITKLSVGFCSSPINMELT